MSDPFAPEYHDTEVSHDEAAEDFDEDDLDCEVDDSYYDVDPITMQEELRDEARNPL